MHLDDGWATVKLGATCCELLTVVAPFLSRFLSRLLSRLLSKVELGWSALVERGFGGVRWVWGPL